MTGEFRGVGSGFGQGENLCDLLPSPPPFLPFFLPAKHLLSSSHVPSALLGTENAKMGKTVFCPLRNSWCKRRER